MAKTGDLIKQILLTSQDITPLVALNHYLRWFTATETELTTSHIEQFFRWALSFEHWRQEPNRLIVPVLDFLQDKTDLLNLDLTQLKNPLNWQIIDISSGHNACAVMESYLRLQTSKDSQLKVLWDDDFGLAFELESDGSLKVHYFDQQFVLIDGMLEPLKTEIQLSYTTDLELSERLQKWILPNGQWTAFFCSQQIVQGVQTKGPAFSAVAAMKSQNIHEFPRLFYSLKRIEQFFIARDSDPLYLQIINLLEKTTQRLRRREENSGLEASELRARAQSLLEHVFRGDNLLSVLINDLNQLLSKAESLPGRRETPAISAQRGTLSRETQEQQRIQSWPKSSPTLPLQKKPEKPLPEETFLENHQLLLD